MKEETTDKIDFTQDLKTGDVERVTQKAREMYVLGLNVKKQDAALKEAKEKLKNMSQEELPQIMAEELSADELSFDNGYKLTLKPIVAGSIPSESGILKCKDPEEQEIMIDRREQAFKWLRENDAGSLIVNTITTVIPRSEDGEEKAEKLMKFAEEIGLECFRTDSVHSATLNSYLKEQIEDEDGKEIPFDTFAVFVGKKASIVAPKEPTKRKPRAKKSVK